MSDAADDRFHSRFSRVLAAVLWVVLGLIAVGLAFLPERSALFGLVPVAAIAVLVWEAVYRPRVAVDDAGVELRNAFHTVEVPWAALIDVTTKYALTLVTPGRRYSAWAAPAPGAHSGVRPTRLDRDAATGDTARPGDLRGTDSGEAAFLVRSRWERLIADDRLELGVAEATRVRVSIHWPVLVAAVALTAASVPAILLS